VRGLTAWSGHIRPAESPERRAETHKFVFSTIRMDIPEGGERLPYWMRTRSSPKDIYRDVNRNGARTGWIRSSTEGLQGRAAEGIAAVIARRAKARRRISGGAYPESRLASLRSR